MQNSNGHQNPTPVTLRQRQISALRQLINLNQPVSDSLAVEPVWKILIFDKFGQDIISPLLSIKELRELGVTLHLQITSIREPLPDVPAVYFVSPSQSNVDLICSDFSAGLYESYYLNFISALNRPRLEDLATVSVQNGCVQNIQKIFDQYLSFITLEDELFTLRRHTPDCNMSFYAINRSGMNDEEMNRILDSVAEGLFSVCVSLGVVPIIRCPRGNAAEQISERLDKKLRDNLRDTRNNLFSSESFRVGQLSFQRPVLIILDRNMDLASMLHHTWTYQALVHDVLELELNKVTIYEEPPSPTNPNPKRGKTKEYDLNVNDRFWVAQKGSPFPAVAEAVQEELESYRQHEGEIKTMKHQMGLDAMDDAGLATVASTNQKLDDTVRSLPELMEKKRLIDLHTNVATALLDSIKRRKLDVFFETEEKIMNKQPGDILGLLKEAETGSPEDKLRLLIQHYICSSEISEGELTKLVSAIEETGMDTSSMKFVKLWKTISKPVIRDQYSGGGTKTIGMFPKLLGQSSAFFMEGVKNLVGKKHNLPVTKTVDSVMEMKADSEDFRYFDPKLIQSKISATSRTRSPFNEAMVFMVGGGNYVEYQNLMDYAKSKSTTVPKKITYGCTELVNADEFLNQLTRLGSEM